MPRWGEAAYIVREQFILYFHEAAFITFFMVWWIIQDHYTSKSPASCGLLLYNYATIYTSVVQTLARGPHAACGQFLCGPRTLSASRILHNVIKILY